jgi:hypothetical protein
MALVPASAAHFDFIVRLDTGVWLTARAYRDDDDDGWSTVCLWCQKRLFTSHRGPVKAASVLGTSVRRHLANKGHASLTSPNWFCAPAALPSPPPATTIATALRHRYETAASVYA